MPDEVHYVYVVTTTQDVPAAERYILVERMKSGVRVKQRGSNTLLRLHHGRQFFFSKEALDGFFKRHVTARLETHKRAVTRCEEALATDISVYDVPDKSPAPPKKGWLDD